MQNNVINVTMLTLQIKYTFIVDEAILDQDDLGCSHLHIHR